ncbi:Low temperature viability protein-domain-containing protein [Cyathus striatus]|nr:Low temperature viability protein-domain-containing protein [Cyathus striatus]
MPPKKSIFRQSGAKHFQLVHRSQRDPLIHDPEASQHVLKPFVRENAKKGKSRADLEELMSPEQLGDDDRKNIGEAALYGIYYDDTEYDYMQHLRQVGIQEDGVDSVLLEAPTTSKSKGKKKEFDLLPEGVLASTSELPRTYESQQAIPESISGFQPEMDPHLRQVLEALEDDAFVDDDLEDDFFDDLVADGERESDEDLEFDFDEDGIDEGAVGASVDEGSKDKSETEGMSWEERFAAFKKSHKQAEEDGGTDDGFTSEAGDTVNGLPAISVIGGKKRRRKGTSEASGYSMSSSSMYRNEALQTLDERFDQMILREYNEDDDEEPEMSDSDSDSNEAPELITSREDFDTMVNEFLNDYEILGRKMKPRLEGENGPAKLDTLRRAMGQDERVRVTDGDDDSDNDLVEEEDKKDRWDCETILSTYSNLENHPRLIRARDKKITPKIHLDPQTGLPSILNNSQKENTKVRSGRGRVTFQTLSEESDEDTETESRVRRQTVARARDESKEEKKTRKAAVKAERQSRRVEKKATKEQFESEFKTQKKTIGNKERKLRKL